MATCGKCGTSFPTCYMDTVSTCPKCGTTFWNDSPSILRNPADSQTGAATETSGLEKKKIKHQKRKEC